jgi:dipeptidyl aminopeptidase/acylaminoacyl peptidase
VTISIERGGRFPAMLTGAIVVLAGLIASAAQAANVEVQPRPMQPADVHRLQTVGDMAISPDGDWVAYQVSRTLVDSDSYDANLFMVNWASTNRLQLTYAEDSSESHPRFSPDGKYLAFIAARNEDSEKDEDDPAGKSQVWLLNREGGEAQRLTELPGGVSSFEWSPDSTRLVLVASDPEKKPGEDEQADQAQDKEKNGKKKGKADTPPPIVVNRYQFKADYQGFLGDRYERLYVFDVATRKSTLLTPGAFDSSDPAWGPGSDIIAFSSKRHGDPDRHDNSDIYVIEPVEGAVARQLTTWEGADSDPVFSPDGRRIVYRQGVMPEDSGYGPAQLAVISVDGGEPTLPTAGVDRSMRSPRWSADGKFLYFLTEDDRIGALAKVAVGGGEVQRLFPAADHPGVVYSYAVGSQGLVALASFPDRPAELYRVSDGAALSDHNEELRRQIAWSTVQGMDSTSKDGTRVGSMVRLPPGYKKGVAYPAIAYIHGGPVGQDGYEFDATTEVLAAQGYIVVSPNYRGSSGRGRDFSRAIYADWGNLEIQDIHSAVDKLVAEGMADPRRLGIGGWSYGGMSTNYSIATDTRYAAAVSGAGISNMLTGYGTDQYIVQYDQELGPPWQALDTYLKISYPFLHADRIKTPTLFMCGELDANVPLINSEQMYQALRSLNVPTELVIYPGQYHGLQVPSYIQDRLERMIAWYGKYLGAASK